MDISAAQAIRQFIQTTLEQRGDHAPFTENDSLFMSGRLDSLAMMNLVVFLESTMDIDFYALNFDVSLIDSLNSIYSLINISSAKK
ncbi:MAG: hypothetical protein ACKO5X_07625 [Limnohabitans sp.]